MKGRIYGFSLGVQRLTWKNSQGKAKTVDSFKVVVIVFEGSGRENEGISRTGTLVMVMQVEENQRLFWNYNTIHCHRTTELQ